MEGAGENCVKPFVRCPKLKIPVRSCESADRVGALDCHSAIDADDLSRDVAGLIGR